MDTRARWTLTAAVAGSGMVFLDGTVVTVALPRIGQALPSTWLGTLEAQAYVYNVYLLSLGSLLVLGGALGDVHGRRRVYAIGMVAFGLASLLCGLAPSMEMLLVARLLKGAAGAILVPSALAIITTTFEGEERGRAFGIWAGASAVTTILGPLVGGVLVDTVSWRAVFLLNLPIAALGFVITLRHVEESRDVTARGRVDWLGSVVVAVAVGGLSFGAIRGQERSWEDPVAFVALAAGLAATLAFVPLQARSPRPLVPLSLFRSRNFAVTNASTVAIYGALSVTMYFVVLYLQGVRGYNAAAAGLATIPTVLFLAVFSTRFGVLAARHGPRRFMAGGPALMAAGTLVLTRVAPGGDAWLVDLSQAGTLRPPTDYLTGLLPGLLLFGLGIMVVVAPLTTALMEAVPPERSGVASAVNNALARVGPQLAMALLFILVTTAFHGDLAARLDGLDPGVERAGSRFSPLVRPEEPVATEVDVAIEGASTAAFRLAMLGAAVLAGTGALVNAVGIRDPRRPIAPRRPAECLPGATPP
jgi:EmrB/QacA subfamily drug resistance transporter